MPALAQYPGQVTKNAKESPELRAVAVLEWTGEAGSPKTSRMVPIAVLDGGELQDGGIYLARPEPLALAGEVEYELEENGKPMGLFDIENSGREQGSWVGYGSWKQMPAAKPKPSMEELARSTMDDDSVSDVPVLHRKKHADESNGGASGKSSGAGSDAGSAAPAPDADRPTLHKKDSGDSSAEAGDSTPDPDRPTLHKGSTAEDTKGAAAPPDDPDRPVLKKTKKKPVDVGRSDAIPDVIDPDRPHLKRGKINGYTPDCDSKPDGAAAGYAAGCGGERYEDSTGTHVDV